MAAMDDYLNWLSDTTTPNSKFRSSGHSGLMGGIEKAANKMMLPGSIRQTMGQNDSATDKNNAYVGASEMQPLSFNNDWIKQNFGSGGDNPSFGDTGSMASNIGMAAVTPSLSGIKDALNSGVPIGDLDLLKVLGRNMNPGGVFKAAISGVPFGDVDWGKAFSSDPIAGVAMSMADPLIFGLTGSKTAGKAAGALGTTGLAAAQGGANPFSDVAAVMSLIKLFGGLFS